MLMTRGMTSKKAQTNIHPLSRLLLISENKNIAGKFRIPMLA